MLHKVFTKSLTSLLILLISFPCFGVASGYSKDWQYLDNWYGDWPSGFAVVGSDIFVPMHSMIMKDAKPDLTCKLPRNAVYHVWNVDRSTLWVTWVKKVPLTIAQSFNQTTFDKRGKPLDTKFIKNEVIEYLVYEDEDFAFVKYRDVVMEIDQVFLSHVEYNTDLETAPKDQWFYNVCLNGTSGWIKMSDMFDQSGRILKGLDSWTLGLKAVGEVHDLPTP
jgi:hypothetical protein